MNIHLVCPQCSYGFEADADASHYTCPNPECAYRWQNLSQTLARAFTAEGRRAVPELVVRSGERVGVVFAIDKPRILIGRADECDVRFSNLAISRKHAEILRVGEQCALLDLQSRTGVFVNGRRVERAALQIGDQILISGILMEYRVRYESAAEKDALPASDRRAGLHEILRDGEHVEEVRLDQDQITVGRHADRTVYIDHPLISRRHAVLLREDNAWYVVDTKSRNGTFVNGRSVIKQKLDRGDRVQFGPVLFTFQGDVLTHEQAYNAVTLEAHQLVVEPAPDVRILHEVSIRIEPGEVVGIIGPSGSGKTTLLNALSGYERATSGVVTVNGRNLYREFSVFRTGIGYVPQDDIIHAELTPRQALYYAARLRLPRDTSREEIDKLTFETLKTLALTDRADLGISRLSGGERKRVCIGVELLTRASLLFLDEPTSGLDPGTEARMMRLFRKLADQGRTLVLTTHVMENIDLLDKVAVLDEGRLVFFGRPSEMLEYFGTDRATHLYDRLAARPAEEWKEQYLASDYARQYLHDAPDERSVVQALGVPQGRPSLDGLGQLRTLASRYLRITRGDRRNLFAMLVQPLIIFPAISLVFDHAGNVLFLSAVAMFWLGCTNSAREIVKEASVYRRERLIGVRCGPYVLSKFIVLSIVCALQALFAIGFVELAEGFPGSFLLYFASFFTAAWSGLALGLAISAVVATSERATAALPMALIPQIVFAGFILDIADMNWPSQLLSHGISTRWSYEAVRYTFQERFYDVIARDLALVMGFTVLFTALAVLSLRLRDFGLNRPKRLR